MKATEDERHHQQLLVHSKQYEGWSCDKTDLLNTIHLPVHSKSSPLHLMDQESLLSH